MGDEGRSPLISVCVPTRNGASWLESTLRSVTTQDVDLEVVVSDDRSNDETLDIAASVGDRRVRVVPSSGRLGMAANWNRAVRLSTGTYIKLLMQDDELLPGALRRQAALLDRYPGAGLAFGPRVVERDGSRAALEWSMRYSDLQRGLRIVRELHPGREVIEDLTRGRLRANAIGEPSAVLIRRSTLNAVGRFDQHLRQLTDLDMWLRIAAVSDLAYDPSPVARFRVHASSATMRNRSDAAGWLDRLWIVRNLARDPRSQADVGPSHFIAAIGAGAWEVSRAVLRRRKSVRAATTDLRAFIAAPPPGQRAW